MCVNESRVVVALPATLGTFVETFQIDLLGQVFPILYVNLPVLC
jgi:hypothetical protein